MAEIIRGNLPGYARRSAPFIGLVLLLTTLLAGCRNNAGAVIPSVWLFNQRFGSPVTSPSDILSGIPSTQECPADAIIQDQCGGGIVFENNWLEGGVILVSALADEDRLLQWKPTLTSTADAGDFSDGRNNVGTFNKRHPASMSCQKKKAGGFKDWYLPSDREMRALMLRYKTVGKFIFDYYWTSSEQTESWGAAIPFPGGGGVSLNKNLPQPVRCIRRPA